MAKPVADTRKPLRRYSPTSSPPEACSQSMLSQPPSRGTSRSDSRAIGTAMKALQAHNARLEQETSDLRQALANVENYQVQETNDLRQVLVNAQSRHEQEVEDLTRTYEAQIAELEARLGEMSRENDRLNHDHKSDSQHLVSYQETLQAENGKLQEILQERDRAITEQAGRLKSLSADLSQSQNQIQDLQSKLDRTSKAQRKTVSQAEVQVAVSKYRHKYKSSKQQVQSLNGLINQLRSEIDTLKRAIRISEENRDALVQAHRKRQQSMGSTRKLRKRSPRKRNQSTSFYIPADAPPHDQTLNQLEHELLNCTRLYAQLLKRSKDPNADRRQVTQELAQVATDMEDKRAQISAAKLASAKGIS